MKSIYIIFISVLLVTVFACNKKSPDAVVTKDLKMELIDSISSFEKKLHEELELNPEKAEKMISLYLNFSNTYKEDSLTPEYLFRAAEIAMNSNKAIDACSYLYRIDQQYKSFDKMPAVIYMLAYSNENLIGDIESAELYYKRFIAEFPEHPRTEEVKIILENLHLRDLDLIREFEKRNKE